MSLQRFYHSSATILKRRGWNNGVHVNGMNKPITSRNVDSINSLRKEQDATTKHGYIISDGYQNRIIGETSTEDTPLNPNSWADELPKRYHYEWFSNCYQLRCNDDDVWSGYQHGIYDLDPSPETLVNDFLVYCMLAHRADALPSNWDWPAFLRSDVKFIPFTLEKSDAKERWGGENFFTGMLGVHRSLRFTSFQIYESRMDDLEKSKEHVAA